MSKDTYVSDEFALLHKLFVRLNDVNPNERNSAASLVYDFFTKNEVHPSDLVINRNGPSVHREFQAALDIMLAEIKRLGNQLAFARQHIQEPRILRQLNNISCETNRWPEVEALLINRLSEDNVLPKHWKKKLSDISGHSNYVIARWQEGILPVPNDVIVKLTALSPRNHPSVSVPPKRKRSPRVVVAQRPRNQPSPLQIQILQIINVKGPQTVGSLSDMLLGHTDTDGLIYQRLKTCWARKVPLVVLLPGSGHDHYDLSPVGRAALDNLG
jgi:hypothetical protein